MRSGTTRAADGDLTHRRTGRRLAVLIAAVLASGIAVAAATLITANYKLASFTYPGADSSDARGINSDGTIVGQWQDGTGLTHGYLLTSSALAPIDVPGALSTYPEDINDGGVVVGAYTVAGGDVCCASYGFVRTPDGRFVTIDYPASTSDVPSTWLFGINNDGQMVGVYNDFDLTTRSSRGVHGFLFDGVTFTPVDAPSPGSRVHVPVTYANGINDAGVIVGGYNDDTEFQTRHGFRLVNGVFTTLDVPANLGTFTDLFDINNRGVVVGETDGCDSLAFVLDPGRGVACIVGTPIGNPKVRPSLAFGLNDAGQIVGVTDAASRSAYVASPPATTH
jgi:probable HAF family extracellular repeat protein